MTMNVYEENKRTLSDKLYNLLDERVCEMPEICSMDTFAEFFCHIVEDYVLVPKTMIITE